MEMQTTLSPHSAPRSRTANLIGLLGVPASVGFTLGADALLTSLGIPPGERPPALRAGVVAIAVAPIVLWTLAPRLSALSGLAWLAVPGPISMTLDTFGLVLRQGEIDRTLRWEDVDRVLILEGDSMTASADVIMRSGERISLPREFVYPRRANRQRTKLLDEIERYRPQLVNAAEHREQARTISYSITAVVIALGIIGLLILYGPWQ